MLNMRSEKGENTYAATEFGTRIETTNENKKQEKKSFGKLW